MRDAVAANHHPRRLQGQDLCGVQRARQTQATRQHKEIGVQAAGHKAGQGDVMIGQVAIIKTDADLRPLGMGGDAVQQGVKLGPRHPIGCLAGFQGAARRADAVKDDSDLCGHTSLLSAVSDGRAGFPARRSRGPQSPRVAPHRRR